MVGRRFLHGTRRAPPRVGLFGILGSGNLGNDASMESVLTYLRTDHPDAIVDAMCKGPQTVTRRYGIPATATNWYDRYEPRLSGIRVGPVKVLGKLIDVFRMGWWVCRHDAVIVPGMGTLEATLPVRPWALPYSFLLLCLWGKVFGTRVAFVSVGADAIQKRLTRFLLDASARLAFYRSYRNVQSREAMHRRGLDVSRDHVYPDLVFGIPAPSCGSGDPRIVGVGVMEFTGGNDDRGQATVIRSSYVVAMKSFVRWLIDNDRSVRIFVGVTEDSGASPGSGDEGIAREILADVRSYRPDLPPARVVFESPSTFAELMEAMAPVGAVVATRFHNVICALRLGKPVVALSYASKFVALMAEMGLEDFWQPAKSLDVDQLIVQFLELERRQERLRETIKAQNARYERDVAEQFSELSAVLLHR